MNLSAEELSSLTPDEQEAVLSAQQPETDAAEQPVVTDEAPVVTDEAPVAVDGEFRREFTDECWLET